MLVCCDFLRAYVGFGRIGGGGFDVGGIMAGGLCQGSWEVTPGNGSGC